MYRIILVLVSGLVLAGGFIFLSCQQVRQRAGNMALQSAESIYSHLMQDPRGKTLPIDNDVLAQLKEENLKRRGIRRYQIRGYAVQITGKPAVVDALVANGTGETIQRLYFYDGRCLRVEFMAAN